MPENFYHSLLDLDPEIVTPDYYQLLELEPDEVLDPDAIEQGYKLQMSKVQKVRSPKYKDLVEFLKGELKTARRTLSDANARERYEQDREADAREKLRDVVIMFIQTSGHLSDIEVGEIHRRARLVNLARRDTDALIDEMLDQFGCERVPATPEQMKRASEIMTLRAQHLGKAEEEFAIQEDAAAHAASRSRGGGGARGAKQSQDEGASLEAEAQRLQRQASRRARRAPLRLGVRLFNGLAGIVVLLAGLVVLAFVLAPEPFREPVSTNLGAGAVHMLYGENPTAEDALAAQRDLETRLAELDRVHEELQAAYDEERRERTPFELVAEAHGAGNDDEARRLIVEHAARAPELLEYYRDRIEPWRLSHESRWHWDFSESALGFAGEHRTWLDNGGLLVEVPADAPDELALPFGPSSFKAGIVEVRGQWISERAPFGVAFFEPGPGGRPTAELRGSVMVDPRPDRRALTVAASHDASGSGTMQRLGERTVEMALARGTRDMTAAPFLLRLVVARPDDFPSTDVLITRMLGVYEQAGVQSSDRGSIVTRLDAQGRPGEWIGTSASGRLELRFAPGTAVRIDEITVR